METLARRQEGPGKSGSSYGIAAVRTIIDCLVDPVVEKCPNLSSESELPSSMRDDSLPSLSGSS